MDTRWFKEDRDQARAEGIPDKPLKEESKKALKNSTLFQRRLTRILEEEYEKTLISDENFSNPSWERQYVANASRRATLKEIIKMIDLKEAKTNG